LKQSIDRGCFGAPGLFSDPLDDDRDGQPVHCPAVTAKPTKFEHQRYVGDKRTQIVHDLDLYGSDPEVTGAVDELVASEQFQSFGPDTLAEARNRGYKPDRAIRRQLAAADDSA
jgi:hypothetical protein